MVSIQDVLYEREKISIQLQRRRSRSQTTSWAAFTSSNARSCVPEAVEASTRAPPLSTPTSHIDRDLMGAVQQPDKTHIDPSPSTDPIHPTQITAETGNTIPGRPCLVPWYCSLVERRFPFLRGQRGFYQATQGHHVQRRSRCFLQNKTCSNIRDASRHRVHAWHRQYIRSGRQGQGPDTIIIQSGDSTHAHPFCN